MSYFISLTSLIMIYQMGKKWRYAPLLGVFNQVLWIIYIYQTKDYGLIIGVLGYTIVHIINAYKWIYRA